jgi:O-antigen ligase
MSVAEASALGRPRQPRRLRLPVVTPLAVLLALAVGGIAAVQPKLGFGLVAAIAVGLVVVADVRLLPIFLAFTIFIESIAVGPLRVGRIGAPLALILVGAYLLFVRRSGLRANGLIAVVVAYGLWLIASMFWADFPSYAANTFGTYALAVSYMLAFAVLVRRTGQLFQIAATLAVGAFLAGLYGIYQYVTHTGLDGDRAVGLQGDPNYFAVYQVITLPLLLVLASHDKPVRRPLYYSVLAVIAFSVVASLSRTGMLTFGLVALATVVLPWHLFFRSRGAKRTYILALVLAAGLAVGVGSTTLIARASTIFHTSPQGDRGSGRTDLWKAAQHAIRDHPWLGLGAGNFTAQSLDYLQTTPGVDTTRRYVHADRPVHNAYLEQLTDLGPVGLALFLAILGFTARTYLTVLRRARAASRTTIERFSAALLVSLGGFCFSGLFLSNQLLKPLWIMVGLALALESMTRDVALAPSRAGRTSRRPGGRAVPHYAPPVASEEPDAEALRHEREEIERRRAAVVELERELRERAQRLSEREQELDAGPPETDLAQRRAAVASERERELAKRAAALAVRERALASLERRVHERAESIARRETKAASLERAAAARARVPEPEPEPVPVPVSAPEPEPEPEPARAAPPPLPEPVTVATTPAGFAQLTLDQLERRVRANGDAHPEEAETWKFTLFYLREHADVNGRLPASFDVVIDEVFGPLLPR